MGARILIVDDHPIVREGLRSIIEEQEDLELVGEASDGHEALDQVAALSPQVVLMDISMPGLNGIDATRQILERNPDVRVVALSMHIDWKMVNGMIEAGAAGYMLKDSAPDDLLRAVRAVLEGGSYLCPRVTGCLIEDYKRQLDHFRGKDLQQLTPREQSVLKLLAEGKTNRQMAQQLKVSVNTVDKYRQNVMKKLGISTLADLVKYAIREDLTSLD